MPQKSPDQGPVVWALLVVLLAIAPAAATPRINEFMAINASGITDEDGATSDWIELHNPDANAADLSGWSLTDDPAAPAKWTFPTGVSIPADGYLLVFASGKDRAIAGVELHTNFSLDGGGEYLALVDPSSTVVQEFLPGFPEQFEDVSYGIGAVGASVSTDLLAGVDARYLVPESALGNVWKGGSEPFSEAGWTTSSGSGLSFAAASRTAYLIDAGTNGTQSYGGALGMDFTVDAETQVTHLGAFDDGSDGMSRTITVQLWSRNDAGTPGSPSDDTGGSVLASATFSPGSPGTLEGGSRFKSLGSALTLQPGAYTIVAFGYGNTELNGNNSTGFSDTDDSGGPVAYVGSSRYGTAGSFPNVVDAHPSQYGAGTFKFTSTGELGQAMIGNNASLFVRYRFQVADPDAFDTLQLTTTYDDGFVAYLNGSEVARENSPAGSPAHNASAPASGGGVGGYDLSGNLADLVAGENVLAFHALNASVSDGDFTLAPALAASQVTPGRAFFQTPSPGADNGIGADYPGVLINELHYNPVDKTRSTEFVELYNAGTAAVDLSGWRFTDGVSFTFPSPTVMAPGSYLVVADSPADLQAEFGVTAIGPWDGGLSSLGETVELRDALGGVVDRVDYQLGFPWPTTGDPPYNSIELAAPKFDNDLGGSWRASQATDAYGAKTYVQRGSGGWRFRPGTSEPPSDWRSVAFTEDATWSDGAGVFGYGGVGNPGISFDTTIIGMQNNHSTVYFRHAFTIDDNIVPDSLTLNYIAEDGAVFYINGQEIFRVRVPDADPAHDASASNASPEPTGYTSTTINGASQYLVAGANVFAAHGINAGSGSSDFAFAAELLRPADSGGDSEPTPGRANSGLTADLPPQARQVEHSPERPTAADAVTITAKVTDPDGVASVTLHLQEVEPGTYLRLTDAAYDIDWDDFPMVDDGTGGDAMAGDHVYTVTLPAAMQQHRHLMRYRITVADSRGNSARLPYADDPQPNFAYFVYDGVPAWSGANRPGVTPVETFPANLMDSIPVYHLLAVGTDVTACQWSSGSRNTRFYGTLIYDGEIYDHIQFNIRGQFSTYVTGKNKWRFRFNRGHFFQARDNFGEKLQSRWKDMKVNAGSAPWTPGNRGSGGIAECLSFRLLELAGAPSSRTHFFQLRVIDAAAEASPSDQYEGDLWGLYHAVEVPDGRFIDDRNLPDGNSYKLENPLRKDNQGAGEPVGFTDINSVRSSMSTARPESWWRDNIDHLTYARYKAVCEVVTHYDQREQQQGYYFHDPDTDKWQFWPWDMDTMFQLTPKYYTWDRFRLCLDPGYANNHREGRNEQREVLDLLFNDKAIDTAFAEFVDIINPAGQALTIADLDRHMWNYHPRLASKGSYNQLSVTSNPGGATFTRTLPTANHEGQMAYMREFMRPGGFGYDKAATEAADAAIPNKPTVTYTGIAGFPLDDLSFQSSAFSDSSGGFARMKWRIGEVSDPSAPNYDAAARQPYEIHALWEEERTTFAAGTTVPPGSLRAGSTYRVRVKHEDSTGRWSHWSDPVEFTTTPPDSSVYQQNLVISELMYSPDDPSTPAELAASSDASDFEFIELMNIGAVPLDLGSLNFTDGVAASLTGSLAPGARAVVVRDQAAFEARYGNGLQIVGTYTGKLSNGGETVTLSLGQSEVVRSFAYDDSAPWPEAADGNGASLVLIAPSSNPDHALAASWRASASPGGNPGASDSSPFTGDPDADTDADGQSALLEHAFGTSDTTPAPLPATADLSPGGAFTISFPRNLAADDVSIEIQTSPDLAIWTTATSASLDDADYGTPASGTQLETWIIPAEPGAVRKFVRLLVRFR